MIYDRENIQISELCPIQFTEPREYEFYYMQQEYLGKIVSINSIIQVLISANVYTSNIPLMLKMFNKDNVLLLEYQFSKNELSNQYYYAQAIIDQLPSTETCVYFEISHGASKLAESIWYLCDPNYVSDIKGVYYHHAINDWNTIFNEDLSTLKLPIFKSIINLGLINSITIVESETTYDITIICGENYDLLPNLYVRFMDVNGILHQELLVANSSVDYELNIPKSTLLNTELYVYIVTADGEFTPISNHKIPYIYGNSFTRTNTFVFDVECGAIPKDNRDEQEVEDFIEQDMINDIVYGDEYEVIPMTFGDGMGIPNWLRKKISRATLCDTFKIGTVEYKRINGAKMEKVEDCENGLATYKIDLQTTNNYLQ